MYGDASHNYINAEKGLWSWLTTVDHKRIGVMYLIGIMVSMSLGGMFALLIRLELWRPGADFFSPDQYNQLFTLHGAIMIFLFIIPSIPAALGNFVLPIMIGAKDVAFPRLNLLSWYIYVLGSIFFLTTLFTGAADTGWTFYTPYSTESNTSVMITLLGAFILGFSSILTGLNFIVTIHKLRAPGMTWFDMPLFAWGLYATGVIQLLATPVVGITTVLLILERTLGIGIFDPALGGDPVLFQHFFWFYSHPAVYIMILPGMGIISEVISIYSHKKIFGYKAIAYSSLGIAFVSFLVWGHHMFTSGQSEFASMVFSFLTFFVGIPSGIKVFNWLATMYKGQIKFDVPMLWALSFLIEFTIGGLTGLFLATLSVDVQLHDTYFIVAHFHYTMMGGTVMAFLAGLHHWWPKMFGVRYSEVWARVSCFLVFAGFNITFLTQFQAGLMGLPRRYFDYGEQFRPMMGFSSIGSLILGIGFMVMFAYLIMSLINGKKAGSNPCAGLSLEWQTCSPPDPHNFPETPKLTHGPYDFDKVHVEPTD